MARARAHRGFMPVLGIDVSRYQGEIDFDAVARSNVRFVFCKATEGVTAIDPMFAANWSALAATPLLRGAYHFSRPGGGDVGARAQAQHFADVVGDLTGPRTLPPALDIETDGGLEPAAVIDWVRAFVSHAEQLFRREMIIYTGALWRAILNNPIVPELGTRMLWTARYGMQQPDVPNTWARWDFWQFTDGVRGEVQMIPGVKGPVDCDRFRGELSELQAIATPALL
jgi:lysozyme